MSEILFDYSMNATTWAYLSSLLTLALYFKFSRFWSLRNLDLLGLLALTPGLLMVHYGGNALFAGYVWLFAVGGLFLLRLLADSFSARRPLLEPNLSPGGLTFLLVSLLVFLTINVITKPLTDADLDGPRRLDALLSAQELRPDETLASHGPGYPLLHLLPSVTMGTLVGDVQAPEDIARFRIHSATARAMAIASHLAVVLGILLIGQMHFRSLRTGLAAATLYLILPYTAMMTGRVDHVLPAALIVWAVVAYRVPWVSGPLLGLAAGAVSYPVFLFPVWASFYWQRGMWRFTAGFCGMLALLTASLALTSSNWESFLAQAGQMFGWPSLWPADVRGFWAFNEATPFRIAVFAAFVSLAVALAIWPSQKNLGTLLSASAALMLGAQFWHPQGGGVYLAWYLPLLLLTIFRPNLEDRVAVTALDEGWFARRRSLLTVRAA